MIFFLSLRKAQSTFFGHDISTAFDTFDLELLLSILETCFGFKDNVLRFLNSYLSIRSPQVLTDDD